MKKLLSLLMCAVLIFTLWGCSLPNEAQRYAKKCWDTVGSDEIIVDEIYIMKYTSRRKLTGDVLDTPMYEELPEQGYAILFYSNVFHSGAAFRDSYACFLNGDGALAFTFDYEENDLLAEKYLERFSMNNISAGELALEYMTNCNYISGMINEADDGEALKGKLENNIWYSFSEKQIEACVD